MGTFNWPIQIESLNGEQTIQLDALVDTGSFFTIVPSSQLAQVGVEPTDKARLVLADGRRVTCDIGEARATIDGRSTNTWVAFGEDGSDPLLGAYTLEGLRLAVDPTEGTLVPSSVRG